MRGKIIVAVSTGVAVIALTVVPATAAQWKKSSTGTVDVCFTGTSNFDADEQAAAKTAAAQWDAVSTNLNVSVNDCGAGVNTVPMTTGLSTGGGEYGLTTWTETGGNFVSVNIQFDANGAQQWVTSLTPTLGEEAKMDVWLQMFCHEMGHALGLPHSTATDSCMQAVVSKPFLQPGASDEAAIVALYGGTAKSGSGDDTTTPPATDDTTPVTIPADNNTGDDSSDNSDDPTTGDDTSTSTPSNTIVTIPVIPVGSSDDSTDPTTGDDNSDDPTTGDDSSDNSDDPTTGDDTSTSSTSTTVPSTSSTTSTTAKPSKGGDKNHNSNKPCFRDHSNIDPEKVKAMIAKWRAHTKQYGGGKHHGASKNANWNHGQGNKNGMTRSSSKSSWNRTTTNGSTPKPATAGNPQQIKQAAPAQQSAGTHYSTK